VYLSRLDLLTFLPPPQSRCGVPYIGWAVPLPEKALIAQIRRIAKPANSVTRTGIGDDCAVLRPDRGRNTRGIEILVTTDFSLEDIHFHRDRHPPESVGFRCLARGLSDIAAMGGKPVAAFLSLALPRGLSQTWVSRFTRGLLSLAEKFSVTLAGGDTAESPNGIFADIVVLGTVPKGKAVLRSGARPGDRIFVSGELGGAAAAVLQLRTKPRKKLNPRYYPRHFYPQPRIELGRFLRQERLATAMIDLSDGLSTDLAHICEESHVGGELESSVIPRASVGKPAQEVSLDLALHGGEDYELLFTAPPDRHIPSQIAGVPLTHIGSIKQHPGLYLFNERRVRSELTPRGWEHFRR